MEVLYSPCAVLWSLLAHVIDFACDFSGLVIVSKHVYRSGNRVKACLSVRRADELKKLIKGAWRTPVEGRKSTGRQREID